MPAFLDELMGSADDPVLAVGARVLGRIGDRRAERLLSAWVKSGGEKVRIAAILALGELGTLDAREVLFACLGDPNEDVRCATAHALGRLPASAAREAFERLALDPSVRVRAHLASALGETGEVAAIEILGSLARDPEEGVRLEALFGLVALEADASLALFAERYDEQPRETREAFRADARVPGLGASLCGVATEHQRPEARVAALEAVRRLGRAPSTELARTLRDPEPDVRIAAVHACSAAGGEELAEAIEALLSDPSSRVRDAVRRERLSVCAPGEGT